MCECGKQPSANSWTGTWFGQASLHSATPNSPSAYEQSQVVDKYVQADKARCRDHYHPCLSLLADQLFQGDFEDGTTWKMEAHSGSFSTGQPQCEC